MWRFLKAIIARIILFEGNGIFNTCFVGVGVESHPLDKGQFHPSVLKIDIPGAWNHCRAQVKTTQQMISALVDEEEKMGMKSTGKEVCITV
jgi:hypothetical protein